MQSAQFEHVTAEKKSQLLALLHENDIDDVGTLLAMPQDQHHAAWTKLNLTAGMLTKILAAMRARDANWCDPSTPAPAVRSGAAAQGQAPADRVPSATPVLKNERSKPLANKVDASKVHVRFDDAEQLVVLGEEFEAHLMLFSEEERARAVVHLVLPAAGAPLALVVAQVFAFAGVAALYAPASFALAHRISVIAQLSRLKLLFDLLRDGAHTLFAFKTLADAVEDAVHNIRNKQYHYSTSNASPSFVSNVMQSKVAVETVRGVLARLQQKAGNKLFTEIIVNNVACLEIDAKYHAAGAAVAAQALEQVLWTASTMRGVAAVDDDDERERSSEVLLPCATQLVPLSRVLTASKLATMHGLVALGAEVLARVHRIDTKAVLQVPAAASTLFAALKNAKPPSGTAWAFDRQLAVAQEVDEFKAQQHDLDAKRRIAVLKRDANTKANARTAHAAFAADHENTSSTSTSTSTSRSMIDSLLEQLCVDADVEEEAEADALLSNNKKGKATTTSKKRTKQN